MVKLKASILFKDKIPLKNYRKIHQTGKGIEQNHPGSKNGNRNSKEITKGDNSGGRKTWKKSQESQMQVTTEYKR